MFDYDSKKFRATVKYKKTAKTWQQKRKIICDYLKKESTVLELGCGEVPLFKNSVKIDIANLSTLDLIHDLNEPIPLKEKFDVIIALELIGHLWNVDGFLGECRRQLLMGNDKRFDGNGYYHWFFSPDSLAKKLKQFGFSVEFEKSIGRIPFINMAGRFIFICSKNKAKPK